MPVLVNQRYRPPQLTNEKSVLRAILLKLGYVNLPTQPETEQAFFDPDRRDFLRFADRYIKEIRDRLLQWPGISAVPASPDDETKSYHLTGKTFAFHPPLHFLVKLPDALSRLDRWRLFSTSDCEGPIELSFDGALFAAACPVPQVPSTFSTGQIARDVITAALGESAFWQKGDPIGPTPIHPEFYLLELTTETESATQVAPAFVKDDVVVITLPTRLDAVHVRDRIFFDSSFALAAFYTLRSTCSEIDETLEDLSKATDQLAGLMSQYFDGPPILHAFSFKPFTMRRSLAKMHLLLQQAATLQIEAAGHTRFFQSAMDETHFLRAVQGYFAEHLSPALTLDREAQLSLMSFAAAESMSLVANQSTLVAAILGGMAGAALTMLIQ